MKMLFLLMLMLSSHLIWAEDCSKVIIELEKKVSQIEQALESMTNQELTTLSNIFDPKVRGPHVPYIENNKAFYYNKLVPTRQKLNKAAINDLSGFVTRLRLCKKKSDLKDCEKSVVRVDDSGKGRVKVTDDIFYGDGAQVGEVPKSKAVSK